MTAMNPDTRNLTIRHGVFLKNDHLAEENRQRFRSLRLFVVNLLAAPGSGKTSLLEHTVARLNNQYPCAVIVGDLATDNDARRLAKPGVEVRQITTGTICHLDASMIARTCDTMKLSDRRLLFIENVGNLVCPASYDLGEERRVVLLSATEGEDKPLKYPKMFKTADLVLLTKSDLAGVTEFDEGLACRNIQDVAPQAEILTVSTRTLDSLAPWYCWLLTRLAHVAS